MTKPKSPQLYRWRVFHLDHDPAVVIASSKASAALEVSKLWGVEDWGRVYEDAQFYKLGPYTPPVNPWA